MASAAKKTRSKTKKPVTTAKKRVLAVVPAQKPAFNARWFKDRCRALGITQRVIAEKMKLNPATVTAMFSGDRKIQMNEAVELARLLRTDLDEVLAAAGISSATGVARRGAITIIGWVGADGRVREGGVMGPRTAPAPSGEAGGAQVRVLRYQTTGTPLGALDGALIYYPETSGVPVDALGRMCVVGVDGGGMMVGTMGRGYVSGTFNLTDMSGRLIAESISVNWAGPVIWLKL